MSVISADDWWDAVGDRRVLLLRCGKCGHSWLPWLNVCPACGAADATTEVATGHGRVYSWVTACWPPDAPGLPRTIAAVELDEGPILYGRLQPGSEEIVGGMPVEAHFAMGTNGPVVEFLPLSQSEPV
jgi:uncharacterized OB-fold protein